MADPVCSPQICAVENSGDLDRFIRFAWQVYEGNPFWVPPVLQDARHFLSGKMKFFRHCSYRLWTAKEDGRIVATLAAFFDASFSAHWKKKAGFLGYFEALEGKDAAVRELIRTGETFLKEKGAEQVLAPVNGTTTNPIGFSANAFDQQPLFLMPYTPSYYPAYFRRSGYRPFRELLAYTIDLMNGRLRRKIRFVLRRAQQSEIRIRPFNMKKFAAEAERFADIYSRTFEWHWGHIPQPADEVYEVLDSMRPIMDPSQILFAERGGETVGFTFTLPDYSDVVKKLNGNLGFLNSLVFLMEKKKIHRGRLLAVGVSSSMRGLGIAPLLVAGAFDAMLRKGFTTCEYSWVLKENISSSNVAGKFYSDAYKRYDVYAKDLSGKEAVGG